MRRGTVLLALGALLLLGTSIGAYAVHSRPPAPPEAFATTAPHVGDAGRYTISVVEAGASGARVREEEQALLDFEFAPPGPLRTPDGSLHSAAPIQVRSTGALLQGAVPQTRYDLYHVDLEDARLLAWTQAGEAVVEPHRLPEDDPALPGSRGIEWILTQYPPTGSPLAPCGLVQPFQGRALALETAPLLLGPCRVGDRALPVLRLEPYGRDRIANHDTLVFLARDAAAPTPSHHFVWLSPELPVPLRVLSEHDSTPGRFDLVRLTTFERGPTPYAPTPPQPGPAPRIEWAPRQPWGPDDAGVAHPFPLSAAYARARDEPLHPELQLFLLAHPEAYALSAEYREQRRSDAAGQLRDRTWEFTVTDGATDLPVYITQTTREPAAPRPPLPTAPLPIEPATYRYAPGSFEPQPVPAGEARPSGDGLPSTAPTVPSLHALWRQFASSEFVGLEPNDWEFRWGCPASPCTGPSFVWAGGYDLADRAGGSSSEREGSMVLVSDAGAPLGFVEARQRLERAAPPVGAGTALDQSAAAVPAPFDVGAWRYPVAAFAGGLALLSGLAALLYALWPKLKASAVFQLFSRIEAGFLLGHPARARIYAAIQQDPGVHFQALVRRLGLAQGTAQHHLSKLALGGVVVVTRSRGFTCYFLKGQADRRRMRVYPVLKAKGARRLLAAIAAQPGLSASALAAATGLDRATVRYHLERFGPTGLASVSGAGRHARIFPREDALDLLAAWPAVQGGSANEAIPART